jgi:hypothetical protein
MNAVERAKLEERIYKHDQITSSCSCPCDRCERDWAKLEAEIEYLNSDGLREKCAELQKLVREARKSLFDQYHPAPKGWIERVRRALAR